MEKWQLPDNWEWKTIPEICDLNPKRPRLQRDDNTLTSFVPMQAVDEYEGKITGMETRKYEEVKRGYTYFEENDVLLAKITPSMENGKAAIAHNLIDGFGFGTTEFHVFRPSDGILPAWIFYYIRRASFRAEAKSRFRGAVGQQRVPDV
jgi:type I restriction enzyme, S subunit